MDKWEDFIRQNSYVEIFEHVSLMTLDTIMKCAFSYQGSHQADSWNPGWDTSSKWAKGRGCVWELKSSQLCLGTLFWDRRSDHTEEGSAAGGGRAGEGQEQEALGLPGHPPICKVSVSRGGMRLCPQAWRREANPAVSPCLPRWRTGAACLTRTSVLKWTRSCLRAMTPQPVASPGSSMPWPHTLSINSSAGKRSRAFWEMSTLGPPRPDASRRHVHTTMCIKEAL
ncbi:uncharacterized protein LOC102902186 isoform X1 [Felis catus]|uniref:uncharacterized protein LOC102902186 isoform X1 n=1 Tax=Felis catus TaxID=9685 RepID=UPI001D19ED4B|nr:uncharacterized protein LOC102902186 isoform X1 [Felis catus]